jgi:WD40 repeat protein
VNDTESEPLAPAGKDRPWLVLDAGGHTDTVRRALFTPDARQIITVSDDKTVRLWDVHSGQSRRILRLPIGAGSEGTLGACAISPDGRRLAVSGRPFGGGRLGFLVHVIDLEKWQIERVLKGHRDLVPDLDFSRDGTRLATASYDRTVRVYDLRTGDCTRVLKGHTDGLRRVGFSPDGSRVAAASFDRTARIFTLADGKTEHVLTGHRAACTAVAWSRDGSTLATATADGFVRVWGRDGQLRKVHDVNAILGESRTINIMSLAISGDGREVLYGGVPTSGKIGGKAGIVDVETGRQRLAFTRHSNTVQNVALSRDGALAVSTGGDDHETYVWKTADGSIVATLQGGGRTVWGVGWSADGQSLAWSNTNRYVTRKRPLTRTIRLGDFEVGPAPIGAVERASLARGDYSLRRVDRRRIQVLHEGKPTRLLTSPFQEEVNDMTLVPGNRAVLGGSQGLYLLDLASGKVLRTFRGHSGQVMELAPSPDGRYFVSGATDQIMCVWSPDRDQPLLSIFVTGRDWIAWTPEGYYAASACGERLMGWQINRGAGQVALFHPAARFRRSLYHPDALRELLPAGSLAAALARVGKAGKDGPTSVTRVLPPETVITAPAAPGVRVAGGKVQVRAEARSVGGHAVTSLRLLVNGRPYEGDRGIRHVAAPRVGTVRATWQAVLPPGRHLLAVQAESAVSKGISTPVEVVNTSEEASRPNLYILAVGVSAYPGDMKLNYAASDADAIVRTFKDRHGGAFRDVQARLLTDKQATGRNIVAGLKWLRSVLTARDVGIVFFSGHGMRDTRGNFYFVPVDVNLRNPAATCVSGEALKKALGNMPGRIIAMFDACHSGATAQRRAGRTDDLARDLVTEDYGIVCMCSSLGDEVSLESAAVRAGFSTLGLVEGLSGKADLNADQVIHLHELEVYAARRVRQMTGGRQNPVVGRPESFRSFPLARTGGPD